MQRPFAELMTALKKALSTQRLPDASARTAVDDDAGDPSSARSGAGRASPVGTRREADTWNPEADQARFQQEMQGVRPLKRGNYVPVQRGAAPRPRRDEDAEALAELADLVEGRAYFDISNSDEFIEGIAHGLDRRLLKKLRRGNFSMQSFIDLHGRTRQEAREILPRFIAESRQQRRRCVLIVHGRGLNSKDQVPVLKESLKVWLTRGALSRAVLAFCTARPCDGGAGAVYVLLRK